MRYSLLFFLALAFFSCAKSVNQLDPSLQVFFTAEPKITASYSASFDYSVKLSRNAVLYYIAVPSGSLTPGALEVRKGLAFGGQKPLSAGKFSITSGSSNTGAVVPSTNTAYDIYMTAQPREGMEIMMTSVHKISGSTGISGYVQVTKWGTNGANDGQFISPVGIAVDSHGNVYVSDASTNDQIQKFSPTGTFLARIRDTGTGDGQFDSTYGIAIDKDDNIYVSDMQNDRIQKFSPSLGFITKWGSSGTGDGQFDTPEGLAYDPAGYIYVADQVNDRIQKFTLSGQFVMKWGSTGAGNGQFNMPRGIAVDADGNVYVVDTSNSRIQKFTSSGVFITKWGSSGSADGQFTSPYSIAIDAAGNVYVTDEINNRVQKFDSSGTFIAKWSVPSPWGIAVDSVGNVYVSDTTPTANAIKRFR